MPRWLEKFGAGAEDVHHFVEKALAEELGRSAGNFTPAAAATSRGTDFRLFVIDAVAEVQRGLEALLSAFLQQAQSQHRRAHGGHDAHAARAADFARAFPARARRGICARYHASATRRGKRGCLSDGLGCARRKFFRDRPPRNRARTGFSRITANSLDAVGDRDFALDYLFALTGIATHLSRLAEDLVIFASQDFSYVILSDEYSTGSSLMPRRKS